jgi:hypothetical protein
MRPYRCGSPARHEAAIQSQYIGGTCSFASSSSLPTTSSTSAIAMSWICWLGCSRSSSTWRRLKA